MDIVPKQTMTVCRLQLGGVGANVDASFFEERGEGVQVRASSCGVAEGAGEVFARRDFFGFGASAGLASFNAA